MKKSIIVRGWAASAVLVPMAVLAGCGDIGDLDANTPGVAQQALAPSLNFQLAAAAINEGETASVNFTQVCVDSSSAAVQLSVDFVDASTTGSDVLTRTINAPVGGFTTGACGARFSVCENNTDCSTFAHTYADDVATTLSISATQGGETTSQLTGLTVSNVAPDASLLRNIALGDLEGRSQTFTGTVVDPGTLPTEIKSVLWTFADPTNVLGATTVSCACQPTVVCTDETTAVIASGEPLCGKNNSSRDRTFLQGRQANTAYITTLKVTDESDASDVAIVTLDVRNEPPAGATTTISSTNPSATTRPHVNTTVSINAAAPTEVAEGTRYNFLGSYTEAGADILDINWDLDLASALGASTATEEITKASFPNRTNLNPANGLSPTFVYNDDNDTDPADLVDRTLRLTVADRDGGASVTDRVVRVIDVNPIVSLGGGTSVFEGASLIFTATAVSGAVDDASTDPINTSGNVWTFDGVAAANVTNALTIVSGCTSSSLTCEVRFLDNDPASNHGALWSIGFTARDEDSSTTAAPVAVTVANVIPAISSFTINGSSTSTSVNESVATPVTVAVSGFDPALALDGAYELTVSYGKTVVTTDVITSATLIGAAPGTAFTAQTELFVDNDVCTGAGSTASAGVCQISAVICEANPFVLPPLPNIAVPLVLLGGACSAPQTLTLTVNNVAPVVTAVSPGNTLIEGVAFGLNGSFNDAAEANDTYTFEWSWLDGSTAHTVPSPAAAVTFANRLSGANLASSAVPTLDDVPAAGRTVGFSLNVTDDDTGSTDDSRNGVVRDNVPTALINSVTFAPDNKEPTTPTINVTVSSETAADVLTKVLVDWGDGSAVQTVVVGDIVGFTAGGTSTFNITKDEAYADSDSNRATVATDAYTITVTAIDEEGVANAAITGRNPVATRQAVVANVKPFISALSPTNNPVIVSEGQAAAFIITTSDRSAVDRNEAGFNLTVNWGDGPGPTFVNLETFTQSTITGTDRVFRAAHVYNNPSAAGGFPVTFKVTDREGAGVADTVSDTRTIAVEVVNIAPTITDLVNTGPVPEGVTVTVAALTDNRGADVLTYAFNFTTCVAPADAGDFGTAPGATNTSAVASTTYFNNQSKLVCVRVCDDDNQPNSCSFASTTVSVLNTAPVITAFSPPATVNEGGSVNLTAVATELAGVTDVLTYAFDCTDNGTADVTNTTGLASCTYTTSGTFTARVTVADGDGGSATQTTTVRVNNLAPSAPTVAGNTVNEGSPSTITVTPAVVGVGGAATRFEYDFDNNGIVDAVSANTTATFAYATDGTKTASVRACDAEGACTAPVLTPASGVGAIVVNNVAPVIATVNAPATVRIGSPVTVSVEATDVGHDALSYKFDFNTTPPQSVTTTSPFATVTVNQVGTITATVTVTDVATAPAVALTATQTKTFDVKSDAGRLTAFATATPSINEGGNAVLTASAADQGGGDFDFAFDCANGSAAVLTGSATGVLTATATCTYGDNGSFVARVKATDDDGNTDERTLLVVVANVAPTLTSASLTTVGVINEGGTAAFATVATDPAGANDTLRFDYDFDGNGTIDLGTAALTASSVYARDGAFTAKVRACDEDGGCSAFTDVAVVIANTAPVFALVNGLSAPASVAVGSPLTVSAQASDAGNDALTYTFAFTVAGVTTTVGPQSSPFATTTPTVSGAGSVLVTVADNGTPALTATQTATFTVDNEAPRLSSFTTTGNVSAINETAIVAASIGFTAIATDRGGGALTYALDCASNGVVLTNTTGVFTCAYPKSGTFVATVTVTDVSNATDTRSFNLLVRNAAPSVPSVTPAATTTIDEGSTVALTATSTDAATDTLRYEFDLDNNGSFEFVSNTAIGAATFRPTTDGPAQVIAVRACDDENACSAASSTSVNVTNVAPTINNFDVPSSSLVGSSVTVSVDASDVGNDTLSYAFEFTLNGVVQARVPAAGFTASPVASATLIDSGSYVVTAFVRDTASVLADVKTTTVTAGLTVNEISVNVTAQADPAVINEGQTTTINVNALGTGPYKVSYDTNADGDFDDVTDANNVACAGTLEDPCQLRNVRFPQNRAGDLSFRVLVKVIDEGQNNLLSTAIVAVTVNNVAPTLTAVADAPAVEGTLFTQAVTADDVGVEDTLTFAIVTAPVGLTLSSTGRTSLISWTPTFANLGANDVTISVTDSDGAAVQESFVVTVAIVDENGNGISDGQERSLNGGDLFCVDAAACTLLGGDTDGDGVTDLNELLAGTDPDVSDAPGAPVIISPTGGVDVATLTPTLTVANAIHTRGAALTYTFCIVDSATDRCIEDVASGETTTSVVFDVASFVLVEGQTYDWYAVANDGLADGELSEMGTFVVDAANEAPAAPDALAPANDAEFVAGTSVSLEARAVTDPDGDAVTYVFAVSTDATFATTVTTSAARAVPLFTIGSTLPVGSYFWRATASDGTLSTTGSVGNFDIVAVETNVAPGAPVVVSPSNTTIESASATLTITAGSDADGDSLVYEFELADNAAFANATTSGAQAGLTFAVSDLAEDTAHFWRARAFDGALYSDWAAATFVVNAVNSAPAGLAILSPSDGSLLLAGPSAFTVQNAVDAEGDVLSYVFTVATDEAFANVVASGTVEEDTATTTFTSTSATFTKGTTYFWRVEASDAGTEKATATASFSIFDDSEPADPVISGGGCGCSTSSNGDVLGFALFGVVVALRRRRRA